MQKKIRKNTKIDKAMERLWELEMQYTALETMITSLEDEIKEYMNKNNLEELEGSEHKVTYKLVVTNRIDTKALKQAEPEIAKQFTVRRETKRFLLK